MSLTESERTIEMEATEIIAQNVENSSSNSPILSLADLNFLDEMVDEYEETNDGEFGWLWPIVMVHYG